MSAAQAPACPSRRSARPVPDRGVQREIGQPLGHQALRGVDEEDRLLGLPFALDQPDFFTAVFGVVAGIGLVGHQPGQVRHLLLEVGVDGDGGPVVTEVVVEPGPRLVGDDLVGDGLSGGQREGRRERGRAARWRMRGCTPRGGPAGSPPTRGRPASAQRASRSHRGRRRAWRAPAGSARGRPWRSGRRSRPRPRRRTRPPDPRICGRRTPAPAGAPRRTRRARRRVPAGSSASSRSAWRARSAGSGGGSDSTARLRAGSPVNEST